MKLENLVGKSSYAEVYRYEDVAIKVFDENYPKANVLNEALLNSRVEETELLIPKIKEVSKIEGKWAITMEFIEGKNLYQIMKEDTEHTREYVEQMVDIQLDIHSERIPLLNKLKDKLRSQISSLDCIDDSKKYELLTRLDGMPKHVKLCHGDFDPRKIIINGENAYIVDWMYATRGNASADVARTYLLLAIESKKTADMYMDIFCEKTGTSKKYVQEWLPIVAAARLTENKPGEQEMLMKWLDVVD